MTLRSLLIIFTILSSVNTFSHPFEKESWGRLEQLRKEHRITFDMPEFHLSHGFYFKANRVCLGGENQEILEPIKIKAYRKCIKGPKGECERETTVHPTRKIFGYRYECTVWRHNDPSKGCAMWGNQPFTIKTEFLIEIFGHEAGVRKTLLFKKNFKVPACKEVE